jgi:hypothetical protein
MINITKRQFEAFEKVRLSGRTNMFDFETVSRFANVDIGRVKTIIANYSKLKFKFKKDAD